MNRQRNITLDINDEDIVEEVRQLMKDHSNRPQGRTETTTITGQDRAHSPARRSAFTIIELLIVITVISLLAVLVVPVVNRARDMAVSVQCKSNLRSLGQATFMFTIGNSDRLPNPKDAENPTMEVRKALTPHAGGSNTFSCPQDPSEDVQPAGSYDWRYMGDIETSLAGLSLDVVQNPAEIILGHDRDPSWHKDDWINVLYADARVVSLTEDAWFTNMMLTVR
jgi:prepilin-type N-terminal cleavage/methylation domain-containing protein